MEWQRGVVRGLVLVTGVLLCAGVARAAEEIDYARTGPYAGIGFIYAPAVFNVDDAEVALAAATRLSRIGITDDNSFGLDARAGYRFHPHLAAEADYQFIPGFSLSRSGGSRLADVTTHTFTLNGKAFAFTDTFQPYAVGGFGFLHANTDPALAGFGGNGTTFAGRAGVGADYYLRPDIVLNVEFSAVLPMAPIQGPRYLPLVFGAQYRF